MSTHKIATFLSIYSLIKNNKIDSNLKNLIQEFVKETDISIMNTIKENYLLELYDINSILIGTKSELLDLNKTQKSFYRSLYDILFNKLNIKSSSYFTKVPTLLFTEFCKGITYFRDDETSLIPIYHREYSCGSAVKNHIEKFAILDSDNVATKNKKKYAIRKCYIERKIYDKIYTKIKGLQEIRHLVELQKIERLYQEYFPNQSIDIEIKYKNDLRPEKLIIIVIHGENKLIEEYIHHKNNTVKCIKLMNSVKYKKEQTWEKENIWIPIN